VSFAEIEESNFQEVVLVDQSMVVHKGMFPILVAFSALMLLIWRQEEHSACKYLLYNFQYVPFFGMIWSNSRKRGC